MSRPRDVGGAFASGNEDSERNQDQFLDYGTYYRVRAFVRRWLGFLRAMVRVLALAAELANKPWGGNAYGLQTYYLGNTGTITHEIWVAFDSPAAALVFLEEFPKTAEWQAYNEEVNDSVSLVRSYMELTAISLNED